MSEVILPAGRSSIVIFVCYRWFRGLLEYVGMSNDV
jgi:hypothetical protein